MVAATRPINKIIAYYRLSKPKRGKSKYQTMQDAYGIKDQKEEIKLLSERFNAPIIAEFTEIESGTPGRREKRIELAKAIKETRLRKATLVIGKQDRLGRDAELIFHLMNKKIHFISADRPNTSDLETAFRSVMDQQEAQTISDRVRAGMRQAKLVGRKFGYARPEVEKKAGHLRGFLKATKAAAIARRERAEEAYGLLMDIVHENRQNGKSLSEIAQILNDFGQTTLAGMPFTPMAVHRILKMFPKPQ